ncbi:MucR family transcriptional regulator [Brevundimonas vesicularis]|uniref:MucR family transcriptional regulator n=1 Tax=Brevundimonas vesicularis TaxID=41276 RepID=UPI0030BF5280
MTNQPTPSLLDMTVGIVANYVSNNDLPHERIGDLIHSTHAALAGIGQAKPEVVEAPARASAAQIRKSITDEGLISFLDGRTYKSLKRHLSTNGITPNEYRDRFGLPSTYPMVSPAYSARRSELAKSLGLGAKGRQSKTLAAPAKTSLKRSPPKT